MTVQDIITQKITERLDPIHLEVRNESRMHNVPPGSESHFKVTIVSDHFAGKPPLARHRLLNETLAAELAGPVHALSLHTMTPDEWEARDGDVPRSPPCLGGSKG
ncbi:MAG: BolA/IbaG family iron-sulfur metabolism protein [Gammaproteobacteria bacterium]|nr:BolA/IbaG family iron-sulfur metabolism protein [Gammaproteobacteria bacterium]